MVYISSTALMSSMRQSIMSSQSQLATAQTELSSGTYADIGLGLGAQSGQLVSLSQQQSRLSAYTSSNALATTRLSATASALTSVQSAATSFLASLTTAASAGTLTSTLQSTAKGNLSALISSLNTTVQGQSIFGGINTGATPITSYTATPPSATKAAVDQAFQAAFGTSQDSAAAASITPDQMTTFLTGTQAGSFANLFTPASFSSTWSTASDQALTTQIAPGQTATTSVSANADAFRNLASAYTMVTELTGSNISAATQQAVVSSAMALVSSSISSLTGIQANVGIAQNAISTASDQITAQSTVLSTASSGLTSVDPYTLNTKITSLQTQIEASYELTNSLQKLSLVNYFTP